ncbi:adhesion G-protein coupled receptor G2-like [Cyprinodon tularosa]|uniref:adhesion G-protein coupled receptor G2-like n=1 Tax=Cyprinodon tularosa TaxID=77115 RepID=UPI0018E1E536|nr:adhesion G-protein coupled receptor G2-like [Cyprinodon tularosa]
MIPVFVLLLLHQSWAHQVCINIAHYELGVTTPNVTITERRNGDVQPMKHYDYSEFKCTPSNETWFNGSYGCINSTAESEYVIYTLENYTICYLLHGPCKKAAILSDLSKLKYINNSREENKILITIKEACQDLFRTSRELKKAFIRIEKKIILRVMDLPLPEGNDSRVDNLNSLSVNVSKISNSTLNESEARILMEAPQIQAYDKSFVPEVWMPVNHLKNISEEERVFGLVSYTDHSHFEMHNETISSMVLRIELRGNRQLKDLTTPIEIIFRVMTPQNNDSELQCHYFDESDFYWRTDGCETHTKQDIVNCACNHATPFAVLLIRLPISEVHWEILSYISYIGCGLSAFFSASSIVVYVFNRSNKMDVTMYINVSLSGALLLLNCTFLLTEWGATVKLEWVCEFLAAVMHYSLLSCFTWMAIEGLHLYLMLIKVFNTYYKRYLLKLSLAGWGIPLVIVATSLCLKDIKQFYGVKQLTMTDTNETNAICWITDDTFFYSVNIVYFALVFIFNTGILVAVGSSICKMRRVLMRTSKHRAIISGKSWGVPERFKTSCQSSLTLLGLTCLTGMTWGLAFLGSGYINYPVLYLFCILNSLQGFFIFMWICLSAKKQQRRVMEDKLSSNPVMTSDTKTE